MGTVVTLIKHEFITSFTFYLYNKQVPMLRGKKNDKRRTVRLRDD